MTDDEGNRCTEMIKEIGVAAKRLGLSDSELLVVMAYGLGLMLNYMGIKLEDSMTQDAIEAGLNERRSTVN